MTEPLKLPELARASLAALYAASKQAEREYSIALNHTVAALGLDPRQDINVNLDTGDVSLKDG